MTEPKLTPESAKALADKVIEESTVPKKIAPFDDIEWHTKAMSGGLASALLTATDEPLHLLQPHVAAIASQMVAIGFRQTDHIDPAAIHAPAWVTDGVRQESMKVPEQPAHTEADPAQVRTATAPKCPKRIAAHARAVRR